MDVLVAHAGEQARKALVAGLAGQDLTIVEAADGARALDILTRPDAPALALVDWDLPGVDGTQLCRRARERLQGAQPHVILMTPNSVSRDFAEGARAGACGFMLTPVTGDELRARVEFASALVAQAATQPVMPGAHPMAGCVDALTKVSSRTAILRRLEEELSRSRRDRCTVGIGVLDVDGLERVNSSHGREAGDAVLSEVARRLKDTLRPYDGVGRLDGEEFLMVTPRTSELSVSDAFTRVRDAMARTPFLQGDEELAVTVTVGGTVGSEESVDELLEEAHEALKEAQAAGGDRVVAGVKVELNAILGDHWAAALEAHKVF